MDNKPGYKTTEFWMSMIAVGIGAVAASGAFGLEGVPLSLGVPR